MGQAKRWGATHSDWETFINIGLGEDLLPVVSNPEAPISEQSNMKQIGKTPSLYNQQGFVSGIRKWTDKRATEGELKRWSSDPDYGICIQTRNVRAIDIDVDDRAQAEELVSEINDFLGIELPMRYRDDSGSCLLAFRMDGPHGKRTVRVEDGVVEFLMTGQQFIAAGTHPKGQRYKWDWKGHEDYPVLTPAQYDELFWYVESGFGIGKSTTRNAVRKHAGGDQAVVSDTVIEFLAENGHVLAWGDEGEAHIECPFKDLHTKESTVSSTTYFPAGSRNYDRGHFVCLHAHCEGRDDALYLDAFGIRKAEFEVVEFTEDELEEIGPEYERDKHGRPKAIINNIARALRHPPTCGVKICYDTFRDEIVFTDTKTGRMERENDERFTILRMRLEAMHQFLPIGKENMRDAVRVVAQENKIDSAQCWLEEKVWDGVPRIERFVADYLGGEDSEYTRAISLYIWTAAAGRIIEPGLKADMIPIMKGPQGWSKSTAIAAMAPSQAEFCEIDFDEKDDDLARKMRGVLVCEIPELRGLRTRAIEAIKAFVARTHEKWIPKYKEYSTEFPRRCVFIATTNDDTFLADTTGNRRWLPFDVKRYTEVGAIIRDRAQLWAEARERFLADGLLWEPAETLGKEHHEKYMMRDVWQEVIEDWMDRPDDLDEGTRPADREYIRTIDVAREALNIDPRSLRGVDEKRIGTVLHKLGYENRRTRVSSKGHKKQIRAWFPPHDDLA